MLTITLCSKIFLADGRYYGTGSIICKMIFSRKAGIPKGIWPRESSDTRISLSTTAKP